MWRLKSIHSTTLDRRLHLFHHLSLYQRPLSSMIWTIATSEINKHEWMNELKLQQALS